MCQGKPSPAHPVFRSMRHYKLFRKTIQEFLSVRSSCFLNARLLQKNVGPGILPEDSGSCPSRPRFYFVYSWLYLLKKNVR